MKYSNIIILELKIKS